MGDFGVCGTFNNVCFHLFYLHCDLSYSNGDKQVFNIISFYLTEFLDILRQSCFLLQISQFSIHGNSHPACFAVRKLEIDPICILIKTSNYCEDAMGFNAIVLQWMFADYLHARPTDYISWVNPTGGGTVFSCEIRWCTSDICSLMGLPDHCCILTCNVILEKVPSASMWSLAEETYSCLLLRCLFASRGDHQIRV